MWPTGLPFLVQDYTIATKVQKKTKKKYVCIAEINNLCRNLDVGNNKLYKILFKMSTREILKIPRTQTRLTDLAFSSELLLHGNLPKFVGKMFRKSICMSLYKQVNGVNDIFFFFFCLKFRTRSRIYGICKRLLPPHPSPQQ